MSAAKAKKQVKPAAAAPQSAAMPSPFPPIADYGFLSDCHTGALIAPDGSVDWLCVPKFDAPSIFGSLLDREAGSFRFGPFGINVPSARIYEPGTNTLLTTWKTPTGWVMVRDALTIGATRGPDLITPHTRPPADEDADHVLVRTVLCLDGSVEMELICEPLFDYGRTTAEWTLLDGENHIADASGAGLTVRLRSDIHDGCRGRLVARPPPARAGPTGLLLPFLGRGARLPGQRRRGERAARRDHALLAKMAGRRTPCPTTVGASRSNGRRWRSRA